MITVQEIFSRFYGSYQEKAKPTKEQAKVAAAILRCKTSALGGHVCSCEECDHLSIHYNSCRDRHCPMCQGINKVIWVDQRRRDILNAPYFHLVLTIPQELHPLIYQNQKLLYSLMYKAAAQTLLTLAADPKYLGAQIGFFTLLHTWAQDLHFHPHLHVVVLAGGLTPQKQWRSSKKKFFIPVKVLSKMFRGKFLHQLKTLYGNGELSFFGSIEQDREPQAFQKLLDVCYTKNWYSYIKETFAGPDAVVQYLGRYTHRIAISNGRIASMDEHGITFRVRDRKHAGKTKNMTLTGAEFVRRFLMHVLPKGFVKVRYYGILAHRNKKIKLKLCRKLTGSPVYKARFEGLKSVDVLSILLGRDITLCPACQTKLKNIQLRASP